MSDEIDPGYVMQRAYEAKCGVPLDTEGAWQEGRPEYEGQHRVSPRECIRAAQEQFNLAYGETEYAGAVVFIRHGVDWLRRALEQMAPAEAAASKETEA